MPLRADFQGFIERTGDKTIPATIGKKEANGTYTIPVPGNRGFIFVTYAGSSGFGGTFGVARGFQGGTPGMPVQLKVRNGIGEIVNADYDQLPTYAPGTNLLPSMIPQHSHAIGSGMIDPVEGLRFLPGLVHPIRVAGVFGLTVKIESFFYKYNGDLQYFADQLFDLTSYVPGTANKKAWVIVEIDPTDNTPTAQTLTEFALPVTMTPSMMNDTTFGGNIPVGAVVLTNGQTTINNLKDFADVRTYPSAVEPTITEKAVSFQSPTGSSGTFWDLGYYDFFNGNNDFSPVINFGTANLARGAHVLIVTGASTSDVLTIRVTGQSITDAGVDTPTDTEDIVIPNGTAADSYYETSKKFNGLVTIVVVSGTPVQCNYGWVKYWDNANTDFTVIGIDITWRGGANDSSADIGLYHHKSTGWTYNAGAEPTPPTPIGTMAVDNSPNDEIGNGVNGAWKRTNFDTDIDGSASEGILVGFTTSVNKSIETAGGHVRIRTR